MKELPIGNTRHMHLLNTLNNALVLIKRVEHDPNPLNGDSIAKIEGGEIFKVDKSDETKKIACGIAFGAYMELRSDGYEDVAKIIVDDINSHIQTPEDTEQVINYTIFQQ